MLQDFVKCINSRLQMNSQLRSLTHNHYVQIRNFEAKLDKAIERIKGETRAEATQGMLLNKIDGATVQSVSAGGAP